MRAWGKIREAVKQSENHNVILKKKSLLVLGQVHAEPCHMILELQVGKVDGCRSFFFRSPIDHGSFPSLPFFVQLLPVSLPCFLSESFLQHMSCSVSDSCDRLRSSCHCRILVMIYFL